MDFAGTMDKAKKEFGLGGAGFFGIKDGEKKKVRIISDAIPHQSTTEYDGEKQLRTQFLVYVIDRNERVIKPWFMPVSVMGFISDLQKSEEYGFKADEDMPYDITVSRKKEKGRTSYAVIADRKNTPITPEELQDIAALKPLVQIIERLKARAEREEASAAVPDGIDKSDLPD